MFTTLTEAMFLARGKGLPFSSRGVDQYARRFRMREPGSSRFSILLANDDIRTCYQDETGKVIRRTLKRDTVPHIRLMREIGICRGAMPMQFTDDEIMLPDRGVCNLGAA